jgi:uncharacterized lipoprotein YajG
LTSYCTATWGGEKWIASLQDLALRNYEVFMKNMCSPLLLFAAVLLLGACAFNPQKVTLQPVLTVSGSDVGKARVISLKIVDERPKQVLGHRGTAYGSAAEITTDQDVSEIVRDKVSEGLRANGFDVVSAGANSPLSMKVEIRLIEYSTSTGMWTGGIHTKAALKVVCKNGSRDYENLYRQENEDRIMVVPTAEKNEEFLNKVVAQTLDKIFQDQELMKFLASSA